MTAPDILFIDDDDDLRHAVCQGLELDGFSVAGFAHPAAGLEKVNRGFSGLVISDIRMPGMDGMAVLKKIQDIDPSLPVVIITGHGDVPMAVDTMKKGAMDFIQKPFKEDQLLRLVERTIGSPVEFLVRPTRVGERHADVAGPTRVGRVGHGSAADPRTGATEAILYAPHAKGATTDIGQVV